MVQRYMFLAVAIRDFNAKSSIWLCHDKTNFEGKAFEGEAVENLTSQFGVDQVIKEPTLILLLCVMT